MNKKNFTKQFLSIFDGKDQWINYNQNPILALLKGPDTQYETILMNENEQLTVSKINDRCRNKNSFLQIHVRKFRPFSTKVSALIILFR